ncbi:hypothetical protein [Actinocorallia longicatena]|uniref:Uncharacterized protein n=1 Tax=Actinocorallia longicatena TaxID=111803 RepID=A0ABP6Q1S2_9ACTN
MNHTTQTETKIPTRLDPSTPVGYESLFLSLTSEAAEAATRTTVQIMEGLVRGALEAEHLTSYFQHLETARLWQLAADLHFDESLPYHEALMETYVIAKTEQAARKRHSQSAVGNAIAEATTKGQRVFMQQSRALRTVSSR